MSKTCNGCGETPITTISMSSADWQRNEQRHERREKRLVWVIVLLIVLFVGSNIGWLIHESQFVETETTEEIIVDAEGDGVANYIGNDGDIINGEDYSKKNN